MSSNFVDPKILTANERLAITLHAAAPGQSRTETGRVMSARVDAPVDAQVVTSAVSDFGMHPGHNVEVLAAIQEVVDTLLLQMQAVLTARNKVMRDAALVDYIKQRALRIVSEGKNIMSENLHADASHHLLPPHDKIYRKLWASWTVDANDLLGQPSWDEYAAAVQATADMPQIELNPPKHATPFQHRNTQDALSGQARQAARRGDQRALEAGYPDLDRKLRVGAYASVGIRSWTMSGVQSTTFQYNPFRTALFDAGNGDILNRPSVHLAQSEVHALFVRQLGLSSEGISCNLYQTKIRGDSAEKTVKNGIRDSLCVLIFDIVPATPSYWVADEVFSALSDVFPRPTKAKYDARDRAELVQIQRGIAAFQTLRRNDPKAAKAKIRRVAKKIGDFLKVLAGIEDRPEQCEQLVHWYADRESRYFEHRRGHHFGDSRKTTSDRNDGFHALIRIAYEILMGWGGYLRGGWANHRTPGFASHFIYGDLEIKRPSFTRNNAEYLKMRDWVIILLGDKVHDKDELSLFCSDLRYKPSFQLKHMQKYNSLPRLPKEELYIDPRKWARSVLPAIESNRRRGPLRLRQLLIIQAYWRQVRHLIGASEALADELKTDVVYAKRLIRAVVYAGKLDRSLAIPIGGVPMDGPEGTLDQC